MILAITSPKYGTHSVLLDDEDYIRLKNYCFYLWGTPRHTGLYVNCYSPDNKKVPKRLHRIIMSAALGEIVDHINGNPLDNRRCNLRIVSSTINNQNAKKRRDGVTSSYKGVHLAEMGKWKAQIQIKGKKKSLGTFRTEKEAAEAYNNALIINNIQSPRNIIK